MEQNKFGRMSANTLNYIIIFLIIIGVSVFSFMNGPTDTLVMVQEEALAITGINEAQLLIEYKDITHLEVLEPLPDFGEAVDVVENGKAVSGTYKNEAYGEYQVHVNTKIDACLLVQTEEMTVLFNIESPETVKELCSALEQQIGN